MRIAVVVNQFPVVSETFILDHVNALQARGHEVYLDAEPPAEPGRTLYADVVERFARRTRYRDVPTSAGGRLWDKLCRICRWGWRSPGVLIDCLDVRQYGRAALTLGPVCQNLPKGPGAGSFDVIHCHFGPNGRRAVAARRVGAMSGPIITTFHGYDVISLAPAYARRFYAQLFRRGELFTVGSEFMRGRLCQIGAPAERVRKLPMCICTASFPFVPREVPAGGPVQLCTVARLVEFKGIEYGLRAVAVVRQRGRKVRYVIAGDGPLREPLERLAAELGLQDTVVFLGACGRSEVQTLYADSQVFLFPGVVTSQGEAEGQGVALLEAQCCGLPVLTTTAGGIPESVVPDRSALLVPPRDTGALADALELLLDHPERWAGMGRAGQEYVERSFNLCAAMPHLERLYVEAASYRDGGRP